MKTYKVTWHTSVGMGYTYYEGIETVKADNDDDAEEAAKFNVWSRGFRDCPKSHIVIVKVERRN